MITFIEQLEQEEIDDELDNTIVNFLLDLDDTPMSEDMEDRYNFIMEELFDDDDPIPADPTDIAMFGESADLIEFTRKKAKRVSPSVKAKRKRLYRKNKSKIKLKSKKRRKTAGFKRTQKKAKRMAKQGKTSTGKRQTRRA
jgi:hypothetical protein